LNISNIPSAQGWLNQFLSKDRKTAEKLLDQLVYITTDEVVNSLESHINKLIEGYAKVAIFPVRELVSVEQTQGKPEVVESYFSLDSDDVSPILQSSDASLGSEAFISNLITQLKRINAGKIIDHDEKTPPSINVLRAEKVDALILVDDLIGSGNRTEDFLNSVYQHPTIKSWLSGKHIEIHVVSYMGSKIGQKQISKWCDKYKKTTLHVLNDCPMLNMNDAEVINLCKRYADKSEKLPIGYGEHPVRVVFAHSAPNNLPAILFRNKIKLKPKDLTLRGTVRSWKGLFPRRALGDVLKTELALVQSTKPFRELLIEFLFDIEANGGISLSSLNNLFSEGNDKVNLCKSRCLEHGWVEEHEQILTLTEAGSQELGYLTRLHQPKHVANNTMNYYPSSMSRAMSHDD